MTIDKTQMPLDGNLNPYQDVVPVPKFDNSKSEFGFLAFGTTAPVTKNAIIPFSNILKSAINDEFGIAANIPSQQFGDANDYDDDNLFGGEVSQIETSFLEVFNFENSADLTKHFYSLEQAKNELSLLLKSEMMEHTIGSNRLFLN